MTDPTDHGNQTGADVHRAETNRANAKHSTGPRTETGKQRSSLNALRHGLTGHVIVLQPKGALEEQLVQSLTDTSWRIHRSTCRDESTLPRSEPPSPAPSPKSPVPAANMHEHRLSRQFERTLKQLREIQAKRREKENNQMEKATRLLSLHQSEGLP